MVVGVRTRVEAANDDFGVSKKAAEVGPVATVNHEFDQRRGWQLCIRLGSMLSWGLLLPRSSVLWKRAAHDPP